MATDQKHYIDTSTPETSSSSVYILYRPNSEYARSVEEFAQNFKRVYPERPIVLTDVDSIEGVRLAELYDILEYPAVLVMAIDGSMLNCWTGSPLPLADDVAGFLISR
jgi:hypothetical protein